MFEALAVSLIMMVISAAIAPSSQAAATQNQEPGKLDIPTADEGGAIPVVFGTCIVKTSNVIWYGDPSTTPIESEGGGKK